MKIKLIDDWRAVLKRAWSFKFSLLAAVFGALEMGAQYVLPVDVPNRLFGAIATGLSLVAAGSRLLAQHEISGDKDGNS